MTPDLLLPQWRLEDDRFRLQYCCSEPQTFATSAKRYVSAVMAAAILR